LALVEDAMPETSSPRLNPLRTAPNLLTLLRICVAPFLVAAILEGRYALSFWLFAAAGLTDALDGTIARLLKQRTMLGQYLDPVADKLLLSTLFLVLMHKGLIPERVTVLVFGRDVGILLVAAILYAAVGRREFTPSIFGKANTVAQVGTVALVLLNQITAARWVGYARVLGLDATMVLTVVSGLHYAWIASHRVTAPAANGHGAR
jgi:cardiolipin synthase